MKRIVIYAVTICLIFTNFAVAAQDCVKDFTFFIQRLRSVDHLPELENSHTAMSSTWNRTGANKDGDDFKNIVGTIAAESLHK